MRADKDFKFFHQHKDWFIYDPVKGYIPTEAAPREGIEAIKRFNKKEKERIEQGYED